MKKALHLCQAAKNGVAKQDTGLGNQLGEEGRGEEAAAASIAAADNSIYITRE